ncbi:plasmid replication protein, CyRepA1 family [Pseudoduganella rivuli]|nr:plasmid replication protein, CyRepA1 family [Pseudoduganella rivuli]
MKIAIHTKIDFKPKSDDKASFISLANDFKNYDLSIEEIAYHIGLGHAFCSQHNGRRCEANFIASSVIGVDIDGGMRIEDALEHPFVKKYGGIIYHTWSSTEEENRFRIVFFCMNPITNAQTMRHALVGAIRLLGGDGACKDACRMFYGNKKTVPIVLGNVLSEDALNEIIALGKDKSDRPEKIHNDFKKAPPFVSHPPSEFETVQLFKTASGQLGNLSELIKGTRLFCPAHEDNNASAFVTESRHGVKGIHCSTCVKTFWTKTENLKFLSEYDFNAIDHDLNYIEFEESQDNQFYATKHAEFFNNDERVVQPRRNSRLGSIKLEEGILLVRSPMGTGKTHEIKSLVHECKQENLSVLLLSHRRTLIFSSAKRIGLDSYLDEAGNKVVPSRYYAICVDSIPRLINLRTHHYDVVLIDESEQVFSHITSDTLGRNRRNAFLMMQRLIEKASTIIACDADLGYLTLSSLGNARGGEMPRKFYINRYQHPSRSIEIYENENHLLSDLIKSIKRGGKYYVCSNSKDKAEELAQAILNSVGPECKIKVITSDTTKNSETREFVDNIVEEILHYDVTISSPSLGTGIDVSFPNDEQIIDGVYGFFYANITTHFDIDQQLGRVRNPKYVKAWVSPQRFNFETEPDVIKRTIVENGEFSDITISYDNNDFMTFDMNDDLLCHFAEVRSLQNASKNNLKENFIKHKTYNGWEVRNVYKDEAAAECGGALRKIAKVDIKKLRSRDILDAEKIDHSEAIRIENFKSNDPSERAKLEKFFLEKFYGEAATEKLIALDDFGKYRPKIELLSNYIQHVKNFSAPNENTMNLDDEKLTLIFKLLNTAKLVDDSGNFIDGKIIDNRDLNDFKTVVLSANQRIKELLGISVRKDFDTKPMKLLGDILKEMGLGWNNTFKKVINSRAVTFYAVDYGHYQWARQIADNRIKQRQSWGESFISSS